MAESVVNLRWAYPTKRQSAYATANSNVDIDQSHPFLGADMGEHTPNMSDNAQHYGKGHEFATRNEILSWDSMFRRQFHATTKIVGWAFAFHTGSVQTSSLGGGNYSHVFEYQDPLGTGYYGSGRQQPVFTVIEQVGSNLARRWPSMALRAIELTGQRNDWVVLTAELQGSGMMTRIAPSSFTFPDPTAVASGGEGVLLRNASLLFEHGPSGSLADISCDVRSFRFRSEFQYFDTDGYCPGSGYLVSGDPSSGQIRNKLEFARRAVVLEFVVDLTTSNLPFERLEGNVLLSARLTVEGSTSPHEIEVYCPQIKYRTVPIGTDGDRITLAISTVVFYDNNEANPFTARVVNTTASYLTT